MLQWFQETPGRVFVLATLLPLAVFALLLVAGLIRWLSRPYRSDNPLAAFGYRLTGGDRPIKTGAYLAVLGIAAAAVLSVMGLAQFLADASVHSLDSTTMQTRWSERVEWARIGSLKPDQDARPALVLHLGYRIDQLTAILFTMVTIVSTCIFVFSLGYMRDEAEPIVTDHEVSIGGFGETGHAHGSPSPRPSTPEPAEEGEKQGYLQRRGRYGQFFLYLSLFCFSMLNLVIADNLFQVFVSWELVGVCSFFLIGFYYERPSASTAANKAFIVNRVGDAGFLVGILIAWTYLGTLNFEEMNRRVRSPATDSHKAVQLANQLVRVNPAKEPDEQGRPQLEMPPKEQPGTGQNLALFPISQIGHFDALGYTGHRSEPRPVPAMTTYTDFGMMPYWLFVVMGIGIFLGCVG